MFLPVTGARPLIVLGDALRRDFPELARMDDAALAAWLVDNAAWISERQAAQEDVNTAIPVSRPGRRAWRPPRYGRAAVIPTVGACGLLDVKGVGVMARDTPRLHNTHENGLLDLREAIHELLFQELVEAALVAENLPVRTVPCYGIVDLGFDVKWPDEPNTRAVVLVRRAHTRPCEVWGDLDPTWAQARQMLAIEVALRRWGLTSCQGVVFHLSEEEGQLRVEFRTKRQLALSGPEEEQAIRERCRYQGGRLRIDGVNLQHTHDLEALYDFGSYRATEAQPYPIYAPATARYERLVGPIVHPDAADFPRARRGPVVPLWANEADTKLACAFELDGIGGEELAARILAARAQLLRVFSEAGA